MVRGQRSRAGAIAKTTTTTFWDSPQRAHSLPSEVRFLPSLALHSRRFVIFLLLCKSHRRNCMSFARARLQRVQLQRSRLARLSASHRRSESKAANSTRRSACKHSARASKRQSRNNTRCLRRRHRRSQPRRLPRSRWRQLCPWHLQAASSQLRCRCRIPPASERPSFVDCPSLHCLACAQLGALRLRQSRDVRPI